MSSNLDLNHPLIDHGIGYLRETSDVGPVKVVPWNIVCRRRVEADLVNPFHDVTQPVIDLVT